VSVFIHLLHQVHDGVTVALAPAKTAGDRMGKVSEAPFAMLMDTKRNVRIQVSDHTRYALTIGLVLA
jgi:hypothetical protein